MRSVLHRSHRRLKHTRESGTPTVVLSTLLRPSTTLGLGLYLQLSLGGSLGVDGGDNHVHSSNTKVSLLSYSSRVHTHTHTHAHVHTRIHTRIHAHARTHYTRVHAHPHTHTHTYVCRKVYTIRHIGKSTHNRVKVLTHLTPSVSPVTLTTSNLPLMYHDNPRLKTRNWGFGHL